MQPFPGAASWAGEGSWESWYQPIIDDGHAAGATVLAANAPRRYVTMARTEGYARLMELPKEERVLFHVPLEPDRGNYRARFRSLMSQHSDPEAADQTTDHLAVDSWFRAQALWDATMVVLSIVSCDPQESFVLRNGKGGESEGPNNRDNLG